MIKDTNNYPEIEHEVVKRGYVPHIRQRDEGKKSVKKGRHHPTRRWVIERTNSWHNRFRKLLIRYEKKAENYLGLVHLMLHNCIPEDNFGIGSKPVCDI